MHLHRLFSDDLDARRDPLSSPLSRSRAGALMLLVAPWFGALAVIIAPGQASAGADGALIAMSAGSVLCGAFMLRHPDRIPFVLAPVVGSLMIAVYSFLARAPVPLATSAMFATVAVLSALFFSPKPAGLLFVWVYLCLMVSEVARTDLRSGLASSLLTAGWGATATFLIGALRATVGQLVARLNRESRIDPLTGVANRLAFVEVGDAALSKALDSSPVGLLLLDIDRFKEINDILGHQYGDLLLTAVAQRLRNELCASGLLSRLGGDEFALLLPGIGSRQAATDFAAHLVALLDRPFDIDGTPVTIGVSIGVAIGPEDERTTTSILQAADLAMGEAKKRRVGYFDTLSVTSSAPANIALIGDLRQAITDDQLRLHFQPKIDLKTGAVHGCEALVRWEHPTRGLIAPNAFIPIAEQTGLVHQLTAWVLNESLRQCAQWRRAGRVLAVSVNISPRSLLDRSFVGSVRAGLQAHGLPPSALCLEVTETTFMSDPDRAGLVLGELLASGVQISIDDFGTGYSSLAYLRTIPATELKIDRIFIAALRDGERESAIVAATLDLAHRLGLEVVAEGVEDQATAATLTRLGCEQAQGYFFARPMPADALSDWMDRHAAERAAVAIAEPAIGLV